jgi:hypothetical protein
MVDNKCLLLFFVLDFEFRISDLLFITAPYPNGTSPAAVGKAHAADGTGHVVDGTFRSVQQSFPIWEHCS